MNFAVASWLSMYLYIFAQENQWYQSAGQTIHEAGENADLPNIIQGLLPHQWIIGSNKKIYLVSEDTLPFYDAKDFCNQEGGRLASINSKEDQEAIETLTYDERVISGNQLWLGLYETLGGSHGEWLWLKRNKILRRIKRFSHWAVEQLNQGDPLRDCAVLGLDGLWEVKSCDERAKALCEGDPEKAGLTNYNLAPFDQDTRKVSAEAEYAKKLWTLLRNGSGAVPLGYPPQISPIPPPLLRTAPLISQIPGVINAGVQTTGGSASTSPQKIQGIPPLYQPNIKAQNTHANLQATEGKNSSNVNNVEIGKPKLKEGSNKTSTLLQNDIANGTLAKSKEGKKRHEVRCALLNFLNIYGKPVKILRVVNDKAAKSIVFNESSYKLKTIFKRIANVQRMKPVEYYAVSGDSEERLLLDGMKSLPLIPGDCQGEFMDVVITKRDQQSLSQYGEAPAGNDSTTPTVTPTERNTRAEEDRTPVSTEMISPPRRPLTEAKLSTTPEPKTVKNTTPGTIDENASTGKTDKSTPTRKMDENTTPGKISYNTPTGKIDENTRTRSRQSLTTISTRVSTQTLTTPALAMTTRTPQASINHVKKKCNQETFGGNRGGDCCRFPFKYQNIMHYDCTTADSHHTWCATTHNFDKDRKWAFCCGKGECS